MRRNQTSVLCPRLKVDFVLALSKQAQQGQQEHQQDLQEQRE